MVSFYYDSLILFNPNVSKRVTKCIQKNDYNKKAGILDCAELHGLGERTSGVYWIQPQGTTAIKVLCEMTLTEGWTVLLYRY